MNYTKLAHSEIIVINNQEVTVDTRGRECELHVVLGEAYIWPADEEFDSAFCPYLDVGKSIRFNGRVKVRSFNETFCSCFMFDPV